MAIFDVEPTALIKEIAKDLGQTLTQPEWVEWVKTGAHVQRSPQNRLWWFERNASILYRVYKEGPVGTESLRTYYGGKKNRGVKPSKKRKSSGKIIRSCLQSLEKEGLIKKSKTGRVISGKGESYLHKKAKELKTKLKNTANITIEKKVEKKEDQEALETRKALKEQVQKEKDKESLQEKQKEKSKPVQKGEKDE